jgi:mono/diheme cytochrome c family protein
MAKRILVAVGIVFMGGALAWAAGAWKAPATAKAVTNPVDRVTGVKLGRALFQENCVICHGKAGKGDGEAAAAMNPRPKSLADKTVQAQTDGELFWKVSEGREAMPGWKSLPEKERWSLVQYIRNLAGKK